MSVSNQLGYYGIGNKAKEAAGEGLGEGRERGWGRGWKGVREGLGRVWKGLVFYASNTPFRKTTYPLVAKSAAM